MILCGSAVFAHVILIWREIRFGKTSSWQCDRYCMELGGKAVQSPLKSMSLEERIKAEQSGDRNYKLLQAGMIMAQKCNTTLYGAFKSLQVEFGMALHQDVMENGEIFVNPVGRKTFSLDYDQFVWRSHLAFPDYSVNDIRIKQFEGGTHFYAYLGDAQLRDGEKLKWNTYGEAYDFAAAVVK